MPTVTFYRFSKRKNSTKRPASNIGGTQVDVKLKDECSIRYPSFLLTGFQDDWNYLKWGDNYYYINDVTFITNDLVQIDCNKDLLATYRTEIGSTNAFIEYSSTYKLSQNDNSEYITDNRISMIHDILVTKSGVGQGEAPIYLTDTTGCMILEVVGKGNTNESTFGFANCFATDLGTGLHLSTTLLDDDQGVQSQIRDIMQSPFDALIRAWYVPFDLQTLAYGQATSICLAKSVTTSATGYALGYYLRFDPQSIPVADNYDYTIPRTYGDFRDFEPYSKLYAHLPFIGYVELDAEMYREDTEIKISMRFDPIGASIIYDLQGKTSGVTEQFQFECGVELPIAQTRQNPIKGATNLVSGFASAGFGLATGNMPMAVSGGLGIMNSVMNNFKTQTNVKGGINGSPCATWEVLDSDPSLYASLVRTVYLEQRSFMTTQDPQSQSFIDTNGRKVDKVRTISYLSGYVKCANASVDMEGFEDEKQEINNYLNGGFFYE